MSIEIQEGMRFSNFVVVGKIYGKKNGINWICRCDCGKEFVLKPYLVEKTRSCGCKRYEWIGKTHIKHGHVYEKLNHIWRCMKQRCNNPNNRVYSYYGGRGIKVCPEWDKSYADFREWAYANGYFETDDRSACTLDRIDPNGDYEPSNCRWVDMKEQSNNRRNNRSITYKGETHNITEWSRLIGMKEATLSRRLMIGWSVEEAFETPIGAKKNYKKKRNYCYKGKQYTLHELAKEVGIDCSLLSWRLKNGWSFEDAVETPTRKGRYGKKHEKGTETGIVRV